MYLHREGVYTAQGSRKQKNPLSFAVTGEAEEEVLVQGGCVTTERASMPLTLLKGADSRRSPPLLCSYRRGRRRNEQLAVFIAAAEEAVHVLTQGACVHCSKELMYCHCGLCSRKHYLHQW